MITGEGPAMHTRSKSVSPDFEGKPASKKAKTMENGLRRGDSGRELEKLLFGGRLKHRHLKEKGPFQEQRIISESSRVIHPDNSLLRADA